MQCSRLREAHRAHPRSQTGQATSSQGAYFVGDIFSKVVASMLFHFFGTLMRDFELQHSGHPRFSASPAAAVVQQMGHYDPLRRVQSRRSRPRAVGRGRRLFCVRHHPPRVHRRVERCALALEPAPAAHTVPVLTACARRARAHRPAAECADAAGTVCGHARLLCGAGTGGYGCAANRSLYMLDKVTPPCVHLPFLDAFSTHV